MIISASRRTDIPGFYMPWMLARLRAGWCRVINPFNPAQQRLVSLLPDEVDALVFWTRAPARLADALPAIRACGHERICALVTLTAYGSPLEPHVPSRRLALDGFVRLAQALGSCGHVRWRYDPILLGPGGSPDEHARRFAELAGDLEGATQRVIVSFVDLYRKTSRRLAGVEGSSPEQALPEGRQALELVERLCEIAAARGMSVQACAEEHSFAEAGAPAGACIGATWLQDLFPGRHFESRLDPGQRAHCLCAPSIDVGLPDTCLHGCVYCYAVHGEEVALQRHASHDPDGDAILPQRRRGTPRVIGGVPPEALEND